MGHALGLQGQEPLEEQERLNIALAGGVTLEHGAQVRLGHLHQTRIAAIGLDRQLTQTHRPQFLIAKFPRQLIGQRVAEILVVDNHRIQQ